MNDASIDQALGEVVRTAEELNVLCDQLNARYEEIEDALQRAGIAATACVQESFEDAGTQFSLGYTSLEGRWRLVVRNLRDSRDVLILLQARRGIRVRAARFIPQLLGLLAAEMQKHVDEARRSLMGLPEMREARS